MILPKAKSRVFSRALAISLAGFLLFAAIPFVSRAAVSAPTMTNISAEAQFQRDAAAAQESLWRKTEVGKIRFQKKLEQRARLIQGMRAELEKQQQTIV